MPRTWDTLTRTVRVDLTYSKLENTELSHQVISELGTLSGLVPWCEENFGKEQSSWTHYLGHKFQFSTKEQAIQFMLRWHGSEYTGIFIFD